MISLISEFYATLCFTFYTSGVGTWNVADCDVFKCHSLSCRMFAARPEHQLKFSSRYWDKLSEHKSLVRFRIRRVERSRVIWVKSKPGTFSADSDVTCQAGFAFCHEPTAAHLHNSLFAWAWQKGHVKAVITWYPTDGTGRLIYKTTSSRHVRVCASEALIVLQIFRQIKGFI